MANLMANPTNFSRRINMYVPAMAYASDVNFGGPTRVAFGTPAIKSATAILNAQSIATAITIQAASLVTDTLLEPYGRTLEVIASGAATSTVSIDGWDYLGQPIRETLTLNGAAIVLGKKAFKYIRQVVCGLTAGTTINLGTSTGYGLPYKAIAVRFEVSNGVLVAAGTLTQPDLTDPATATTGDPRGTYALTTTADGAKIISAEFEFFNDVNTSNRGGLHGIAHFTA